MSAVFPGSSYSQEGPCYSAYSTTRNPLKPVESRLLEPPRETKIGSRNREVREIESKITEKFIQGKRKLVREIGRFEESRVREIGGFHCTKFRASLYF